MLVADPNFWHTQLAPGPILPDPNYFDVAADGTSNSNFGHETNSSGRNMMDISATVRLDQFFLLPDNRTCIRCKHRKLLRLSCAVICEPSP
jgi:hypothetical protein